MKKSLLFFVIGLMASPLLSSAQYTLTNSNAVPLAGESFLFHVVSYQSAGNAGANVTWDFSNLSSQGTVPYDWVQASTLPNASDFPNATIGYGSQSTGYEYISANTNRYSREGVVAGGTVIAYTDIQDLLQFPMNYNDTYMDNFAGSFTNQGVTFDRSGSVTVTADAHGTLILPWGTVNNVVRIKYEEDYQDDYSIGGTPQTINYDSEIHAWYREGTRYPILFFSSVSTGTQTNQYAQYMDQGSALSIEEDYAGQIKLGAYPNPAAGQTMVEFKLEAPLQGQATLYNTLGKEVWQQTLTGLNSGFNKLMLPLQGLANGTYILQLNLGENQANQRIQVMQ